MSRKQRPDPADVVKGKSAGSGQCSDIGGTGQSVVENYTQVPHSRQRGYRATSTMSDRSMRAAFGKKWANIRI